MKQSILTIKTNELVAKRKEIEEYREGIEKFQSQIEEKEDERDDKQSEIDSFDKSEHYDEDEYIEVLREIYGTVEVCGMTMDAADLLYEHDYTAFRTGMNEYIDGRDLNEFPAYCELMTELEDINDEISTLESDIESDEESIEELENEIEELTSELEELESDTEDE